MMRKPCIPNLASQPGDDVVDTEPIMDVAHLGHLELLTPKPEESLRFFVDVLGMTESGRQGRVGLSAGLGRLRALLAQADGLEHLRPWPRGLSRP